jgi:hypothetical protein
MGHGIEAPLFVAVGRSAPIEIFADRFALAPSTRSNRTSPSRPDGQTLRSATGGEQRGREQGSAPKNHVAGSTERMLWTAGLMDKNADLLVAIPETAHAAMLTNCVMRTSVNQGAALNATKWLRITSKLVISNRNQEVAHEQCD